MASDWLPALDVRLRGRLEADDPRFAKAEIARRRRAAFCGSADAGGRRC
jgi:hypothetical protein